MGTLLRILLPLTAMTAIALGAVKIEKAAYKGWPNCYRVSNGEVELIVTSDVGPRVIRYGFVNGQNMFAEFAAEIGKKGEKEWMARGGHRLWLSPEVKPGTYALDNGPVRIEVKGETLEATQPVEPETGLQKQIIVKLAPSGTRVEVIHRLRNTKKTAAAYAPWALTMMAQGGVGISGFPPRGRHPEVLPPTNPLVMWAYTDLSDNRWIFTKKYIGLRQDPKNSEPQKIGLFNPKTWAAYLLGSEMFVKQYDADPAKTYPDFGCSFETFTNDQFLELETVGPLASVPAGGAAEHIERWSLHKNAKPASWTDAELDRIILPALK